MTADDGYQAQRSYPLATPPRAPALEITVEGLEDGEVSPWLAEEAEPRDMVELRGPIGGYFDWYPARGGPLLLVAGGSGLVPRGPTGFVERVADELAALGHDPTLIRTERFGAT